MEPGVNKIQFRNIDERVPVSVTDVQGNLQVLTKNFERLEQTVQSQVYEARALFSKFQASLDSSMTNITTVQSLMHSGLNEITTTPKDVQIGGIKDDSLKTIILGSVTDSATTLSHIFLFIENMYSSSYAVMGSQESIREKNSDWLRHQFEELLADSQDASSTELRHRKRRKRGTMSYDLGGDPNLQPPPVARVQRGCGQSLYSTSHKRKSATGYDQVEVNLPLGTVRLHLTRNRTSDRIIGVHMLFIPAVDYLAQLKGISARSMKFPRNRNSISRSLTTFRVLRDDSLVFEFIQTGNIAGIRNLLGTRQIHPTDRDTDGESLLYVRSLLLFKDLAKRYRFA